MQQRHGYSKAVLGIGSPGAASRASTAMLRLTADRTRRC